MTCSICLSNKVDPQIRVLVGGRIISTFDSWLKAENWVLTEYKRAMTKCSIVHVYVCSACRKEDVKYEAIFADGRFVYTSHREESAGLPV